MKKIFKALKFSSVVLLIMLSFIACDKEFNSIESDVLGKDNANFNTGNVAISILAYNKKLDSLQINGLASTLFGVFNDPAFGQTTASIITQVTPTAYSPDFGDNPVIDSVVLRVPYFYKVSADSPDNNGNIVYTIKDSLYGSSDIKLSIYQNNYFLRDFNPNSEFNDPQNYFSKADGSINNTDNFAITNDAIINFDTHKSTLIHEDETFTASSETIVLKTGDGDDAVYSRQTPSLRVKLDNDYWKALIIDKQDDPVLSNANNFKDYFRGLYFKAEAITGNGNMTFFNLNSSESNIIIYYSKDSTVEDERTQTTFTLSFTGNKLNTFINNYDLITLENGDKSLGDEKLYLKGTEGSMAIVDLFNGLIDCDETGTQETALDCFKRTYRKVDDDDNFIMENGSFVLKQLINEAQLIIYEDETMSTPSEDYHKYDRIYAYDIKNNVPTIDYSFDPSENTTNPYSSKIVNLGQRITDENGVSKYKIRITEHLNNILLKDSTNTKLGLILSTNVNYTNSAEILESEDVVTKIPAAAILTSRGTILYGNHEDVPEDKKMKLEIFFTEPNY